MRPCARTKQSRRPVVGSLLRYHFSLWGDARVILLLSPRGTPRDVSLFYLDTTAAGSGTTGYGDKPSTQAMLRGRIAIPWYRILFSSLELWRYRVVYLREISFVVLGFEKKRVDTLRGD
jgi:hypothetical protein